MTFLTFTPNNTLKLFFLPLYVFLGLTDLEVQERNAQWRSASIREPSHNLEGLKVQLPGYSGIIATGRKRGHCTFQSE